MIKDEADGLVKMNHIEVNVIPPNVMPLGYIGEQDEPQKKIVYSLLWDDGSPMLWDDGSQILF